MPSAVNSSMLQHKALIIIGTPFVGPNSNGGPRAGASGTDAGILPG